VAEVSVVVPVVVDALFEGLLALLRLLNGLFDVGVALDSFGFGLDLGAMLKRLSRRALSELGGLRVAIAGVGGFVDLATFDDLSDAVSELGLDVSSFAVLSGHSDVGVAVSVDGGDKAELLLGLPSAEQHVGRLAGLGFDVIELG
jgi:hypothetical protein